MNHKYRRPFALKLFLLVSVIIIISVTAFIKLYPDHVTYQAVTSKNIPPVSHQTSRAHVDAGLQTIISTWASAHNFDATVVATELNGSLRSASLEPQSTMITASTYKIYVAYATLHQIEQGQIKLATPIRTGQTVQQALNKMILQSDNASAEALGFLIGWDRIDTLAANVGATHTDINNYDAAGNATNGDKHSTAGDLANMLTKLQQGTLLNKTDTQLLLTLMKNQVWRERIPAGVPNGITVADKPGWLDSVENDAAIVYGPRSTYVLIIMTTGSTTQPLTDLSSQVYTYLEH